MLQDDVISVVPPEENHELVYPPIAIVSFFLNSEFTQMEAGYHFRGRSLLPPIHNLLLGNVGGKFSVARRGCNP